MTMLDRMRRHRGWLKWSLGIVVATFIFLYVPQFLEGGAAAGSNTTIATVDGRPISAASYQQAYTLQVTQIRNQYGDLNDQVLRQLGVGERIVQKLIAEEAVLAEARRLGITVSNGELRARLLSLPMFQNNGQFVGEAAYRQMLANARPPLSPAEFEEDFRRSLIGEKFQAAVTGWIRVPDAEVDQEFRHRNEKAKLDLAVFTADAFKPAVSVTPADVSAYFSSHQENYRVPEKRRVRYIAVDAQALRSKMTVTPQEVEARYKDQIATYSTPEQVRASHILLKTEGKDEAAVRKVAESVLAKVNAGGDFAALAKQYSEDDGSKAKGGDLDFFSKGAMVKEFEDAAWALQPGQTSGLVKSPFGFHIIRVTGKNPATTKTLDEVRASIEDAIRFEKARDEASRVANAMAGEIKAPADLDRVAKERGLTVGDSGLFSREEPLAGLGFAPTVAAEAFSLETNKVSGMLTTNQGYAFIALAEVKPSGLPTLEEVQTKVNEDVVRSKALELATQKANAVSAAKSNFLAAAKSAGAAVKTTDFVARGATLPDIGVSEKVDTAAFALPKDGVSAPITTDTAVVVVHVQDRQDVAQASIDAGRDALRTELTQQRALTFLDSYMTKAKAKMKITYNEAALNSLLQGR
jgi:peptidyl-prolyl cis-trans isomerase D